jgi:hypothetical protein
MTRNYIGVDLAKDTLEIRDPVRGGSRVANRPAAISRWLGSLGICKRRPSSCRTSARRPWHPR